MNREERKKLAEETLAIINCGHYTSYNNNNVSIKNDLDYCLTKTKLYRPSDFDLLKDHIQKLPHNYKTQTKVTNQSSLAAVKDAIQDQTATICCLNFASAKNPGGGFLNGSQAQEESLARSSGLYYCISKQEEMYDHNRRLTTCLYSDYMIYSPDVPIFRDDDGKLLECPHKVSFITAPAVNAGAVIKNERHNKDKIIPYLEKRAKYIFYVAAKNKCDTLILGAWGCGVFQNDPKNIANIFHHLIYDDLETLGLFKEIIFAIYDSTQSKSVLNAFLEKFSE